MKIGDRVKIRSKVFHLNHRKNKNGVVVRIDGDYIIVRPMWCRWVVELYPNEICIID